MSPEELKAKLLEVEARGDKFLVHLAHKPFTTLILLAVLVGVAVGGYMIGAGACATS